MVRYMDWDKHFVLNNDIDLAGEVFTSPILGVSDAFSGSFDGNGRTISNLTINASGMENVGFIGKLDSDARVRNLTLADVNISGSSYTGGLCGDNSGGEIHNCHVSGNISCYRFSGGLCGDNSGNVSQCSVEANIENNNSGYDIGGLCGFNQGEIDQCFVVIEINSISECVGGFCGLNAWGQISNCYVAGSVIGNDVVAGFCGLNDGNIDKCYSSVQVTSSGKVGGFCAENMGMEIGSIVSSYWDTDISGLVVSDGGWGLTANEMKAAGSYYGWNNGYWTIDEGNGYPHLAWEDAGGMVINTDYPAASYYGDGTDENPYQLSTVDDLSCLMWRECDWDKSFILINDIDMNGYVFTHPVIGYGSYFSGNFDGNGHLISNFTIDAESQSYVGFFRALSSATVHRLGLDNIIVNGGDYVGGVCGGVDVMTVMASVLSHCYFNGSVTGTTNIGGLCGVHMGEMNQCYATGSVSGVKNVGGLLGESIGYTRQSYAVNVVSGSEFIGGISGWSGGVNEECFWNIEVSGCAVGDGGGYIYDGMTGLTIAEMQTASSYTDAGWDFSTIDGDEADWIMPVGSYPLLTWQSPIVAEGVTALSLPVGTGVTELELLVYGRNDDMMFWTLSGFEDQAWITSVEPFSGISFGSQEKTSVKVTIDCSSLISGDYSCEMYLDNGDGLSLPIGISLHIYEPVGMAELEALAEYWLYENCVDEQDCAAGDYYIDGVIDMLDFAQLAQSWMGDGMKYDNDNISDDFETGDLSRQNWELSGDADWFIDTDSYEGDYSLRSGQIEDDQWCSVAFTVDTTGFSTVSFAYKCSTESCCDPIVFYIDGQFYGSWAGNTDWTEVAFSIEDGEHTFTWSYTKDGSVSSGSDAVWIDNVVIE